ncbi:MAG: response regulator [Phycisphaeraceae bacterium]|nr:response regulator [Phycisphaeraceae bacterium]
MSTEETNNQPSRILLVDDEPLILKSLTRLLYADGYEIDTAADGQAAVEMMRAQEYAVVISDQRMPGMSGSEVLREACELLPHATRITLTGYTDIESAIRSVNEGSVQYFLLKPWENDHLRDIIHRACERQRTKMQLRMAQATIANQRDTLLELNTSLKARVLERTTDLVQAHEETHRALVLALDARERATAGHSYRAAVYTIRLAIAHKLPSESFDCLYRGSILHDIGKIGVPDNVLLKPGKLTDEERCVMQEHVRIGAAILNDIGHLRDAKDIPLYHHEKFDGSGYPNGLAGEAIPIGARLFALIDVYDALTSERCYKSAMLHEQAAGLILKDRGKHFDPDIVDTFLAIPASDWQVLRHTASCLGGLKDVVQACKILSELPSERRCA